MFKFLRKTLLTVLCAAFASQASAMFIQPDWLDPTQPGVGTNRYSYSANDPINKFDPNGNAFDDWGMDQEEADKFNREEAERLEAAAQKLREDDTLDGRISRFLGGVGTLEDIAAERRARIGLDQSGRIKMDVGELVGTALMGIRPMGVGIAPRGLIYENPSALVKGRISELGTQIPANSSGRITMGVAVVEDANGARSVVVATSEANGYLRPGVTLKEGEILVRGPAGSHAEADIVGYASRNGLRVLDIGATRPVCAGCQGIISPDTNISTGIR